MINEIVIRHDEEHDRTTIFVAEHMGKAKVVCETEDHHPTMPKGTHPDLDLVDAVAIGILINYAATAVFNAGALNAGMHDVS